MPGQTKRSVIRRCVARIPGCEGLWNWSKTRRRKGAGIYGRGKAVVISQRMLLVENGNGRAWRCKDVERSRERSVSFCWACAMSV